MRDPSDGGGLDASRPDGGPCVPRSCEELRANCGEVDDGCGTLIPCGECTEPDTCGGGGLPNLCDCTPSECRPEQCGAVDVGCGFLAECGGCAGGEECVEGVCSCTPEGCNGRCGTLPDGCGETLTCPGCDSGQTCGGGGPNLCGTGTCSPLPCPTGYCGPFSDGCGNVLECGACLPPDTCGGGDPGVANVCGCTPQTCADLGAECGMIDDGCGGTETCGRPCDLPETCGGGGTPNRCGCMPPLCGADSCGTLVGACGSVDCGDCDGDAACNGLANRCECVDFGENDDTFASASPMAALSDLAPTSVTNRVLLGAASDWFRFPVADRFGSGVHRFEVELSGAPADGDFSLEAFAECAGGLDCLLGNAVFDPAAGDGCRSASAAPSNERVILERPSCHPEYLLVRVFPATPSAACDRYSLRVDYDYTLVEP